MLLCELLTGAPAFRGEGMHDLNTAILEETPVIPRGNGRYGDGLRKIILKCLAKKPEDRYASVTDLIRDLESVQTPPGRMFADH
jgi:serine/threonine protein kinase